jgi:hypothetical protein
MVLSNLLLVLPLEENRQVYIPDEYETKVNRPLCGRRCQGYLRANGIDLATTPAVLGPWVSFDAQKECFVNEFAEQANALCHRDYRAPFTVPKIV